MAQLTETPELGIPTTPDDISENGRGAAPKQKRRQRPNLPAPQGFPWIAIAIVVALTAFPKLPFVSFSLIGVAIQGAHFTIVAASLVMLIGWVGQISLGHAALVGIGAFATGWAVGAGGLPFPLNILVGGTIAAAFATIMGGVALRVRGLYLAVATLIFSWMADAFLFNIEWVTRHSFLDVPVAGNPEGIPRFDFGERVTSYYITWGIAIGVLFVAANIRDSRTGRAFYAVRGSEVGAASLGIDVTRYKLMAFTFSGFLAGLSGGLVALDSQSISPTSFQFTVSLFYVALAVVGGLVSLGGAVASSVFFAGLNEIFFRFRALGDALDLVSAALLALVLLLYRGGLAAVPASVANLVERGRDIAREKEPARVREVREGIPVVLRREFSELGRRIVAAGQTLSRVAGAPFRAGDVKTTEAPEIASKPARRRLPFRRARPAERVAGPGYEIRAPQLVNDDGNPVELTDSGDIVPIIEDVPDDAGPPIDEAEDASILVSHLAATRVHVVLPADRGDRVPLLEARGITVRFGGLTAVSNASLSVREHEITALIGPNGAGKTTLFNAIAGLNSPTEGEVHLFGHDVTALPMHLRAQLGVARTFQAIQLFPQLNVFDNLVVATHVHNDTGFFSHAFASDRSLVAEQAMRERVTRVIDELRLTDVAYRVVSDLPFGVLRMVEVARAMVTDFPLIMLDEPASGLDNRETDRLAEMLFEIRAHGVTLLLIEHDVRMVTSVSDYMYVINRGEVIAEGPPAEVQRNEAVLAAYLGEPTVDVQEPVGARQ